LILELDDFQHCISSEEGRELKSRFAEAQVPFSEHKVSI